MRNQPQPFSPPAPPPAPPATTSVGCGTYALLIAASAWLIGMTFATQTTAWFTDQIVLYQGTPLSGGIWLAIAGGLAVAQAIFIAPLAIYTRLPRFKAVYQTWLIAIGLGVWLSLVRLLPRMWTQAAALTQMILCLVALLVLWLVARRSARGKPQQRRSVALALAIAPMAIVPWLLWGALGSWTDTALGLLAGLSFGALGAVLLDRWLFDPLQAHGGASGWLSGWAAGVAVLLLVAGFGFDGTQLLLMLALPALGFALAGVQRLGGRRTVALLLGLATAAPLLLFDPAELVITLGTIGWGDIPGWAFGAAALALVLAWVVGAMVAGLQFFVANRGQQGTRHETRDTRSAVASPDLPISRSPNLVSFVWLAAAALWAGAALLYGLIGQPGVYGDQLFVIMKDQADMSSATQIADRTTRVRTVYTTLADHAQRTQVGIRADLDRFGIRYKPYYLVNAIEVEGGPLVRAYLARRSDVDRILDNPRLRPLPVLPSPMDGAASAPTAPPWNITAIGADRVWNELGVRGAGIVVGQSDSGVQGDHPALADSYRGRNGTGNEYNWLDPWDGTAAPTDIGGHGTHTLGSVLGDGGIGVAPDAQWFGCVNLARNLANPALYLDCMQFMLAPHPQNGDPLTSGNPALAAHVINNSWGCPPTEGCDPQSLQPGIDALRAAGIFVVASAGNSGPDCGSVSDPPAIYDAAFSVGAIDEAGNVTDFSSRGPVTVDGSDRIKPDILAPGADVLSSLPGNTYGPNDGTSMAGPHIAGVVALMWSANPSLIGNIDRTEQILIDTAKPYSGSTLGCFTDNSTTAEPNAAFGYGVVDAYAAVQAAQNAR